MDFPNDAWFFDGDVIVVFILQWSVDGTFDPAFSCPAAPSRRILEEENSTLELPTEGTTTVNADITLEIQKESLSNAAIAGIAAAAGVVFFLVVFVMWRQGCFEDKRKKKNTPKTVAVDGDGSETTENDQV